MLYKAGQFQPLKYGNNIIPTDATGLRHFAHFITDADTTYISYNAIEETDYIYTVAGAKYYFKRDFLNNVENVSPLVFDRPTVILADLKNPISAYIGTNKISHEIARLPYHRILYYSFISEKDENSHTPDQGKFCYIHRYSNTVPYYENTFFAKMLLGTEDVFCVTCI